MSESSGRTLTAARQPWYASQQSFKLSDTHFPFYKNMVYKNVKPQLCGYLKNIFIAETAFSSNFNAFLRTNALFLSWWDLKKLRTP